MRWFNTKELRSSIYAIFSVSSSTPAVAPEQRSTVEDIRQAMLDLAALDASERSVFLARRIRYASDLQALWFMRGELMALLARTHGEAAALEKVETLSSMFTDLLPKGLRSRPSPLNTAYRHSRPGGDEG